MSGSPDWDRMQKALAIEAEYGYTDLQGQQYRFGEFLCLSFGKPPEHTSIKDRQHWRELAFAFNKYPDLTLAERKELIAKATEFLAIARQVAARLQPSVAIVKATEERAQPQHKSNLSVPKVTSTTTTNLRPDPSLTLDRYLRDLPKIGLRKSRNFK